MKYKIAENITVLQKEGQICLINPVLHRFIKLTEKAYCEVKKSITHNSFSEKMVNNKLLDFLCEKEFIIPECKISSPIYAPPKRFSYAIFEITGKCNLQCITCFNSSSPSISTNLSTDQILAIFKKLKEYGITKLGIGGGEPFIIPEILIILKTARELFDEVIISTNGTLLTKEICQELKQYPPNIVQISLDGFTKDIHEKIRGKGTWAMAIAGLTNLKDSGFDNVLVKPTLTKLNYTQLGAVSDEFAKHWGVKIGWSKFTPLGRGKNNLADLGLSTDEYLNFLKGIYRHRIDKLTPPQIENITSTLIHDLKFYPYLHYCGAGTTSILIDARGNVYPCIMFRENRFLMGNILQNEIAEFEGKFIPPPVDYLPVCKNCEARYFCCGSCRGEPYLATGNMYAPNPNCKLYKTQYKRILWGYAPSKDPKQLLMDVCII